MLDTNREISQESTGYSVSETQTRADSLWHHIRSMSKAGTVALALLFGQAEGQLPATAAELQKQVQTLFPKEYDAFVKGKMGSAELVKQLLSITENTQGKDAVFLKEVFTDALSVAASGNDMESVINVLQKAQQAQMTEGPLFSDDDVRNMVENVIPVAAGKQHTDIALELIALLEGANLASSADAWKLRGETLSVRKLPPSVADRLPDMRRRVELTALALEQGQIDPAAVIIDQAEKISASLPRDPKTAQVRLELKEVKDAIHASAAIKLGTASKADHTAVGVFRMSRGSVPEAYAALEKAGNPFVTQYPFSKDPQKQLETAKSLVEKVEKSPGMDALNRRRMLNAAAYFAREAQQGGALRNGDLVMAQRIAGMAAATAQPAATIKMTSFTFDRTKTNPASAVSAPIVGGPARPEVVAPASAMALPTLPADVDVSSLQGLATFLLQRGCSLELESPNKNRPVLSGPNAVWPAGAKLYGITIVPRAVTPEILAALKQTGIRTRITAEQIDAQQAAWLLHHLSHHYALDVRRSGTDDAAVQGIPETAKVSRIVLTQTTITDSALAHLAKNSKITAMMCANTRISDKGLAAFAATSHVMSLDLTSTQITDIGLTHLGPSPLNSLRIGQNSRITDRGAAIIATSMPNLETLYVGGTSISFSGLQQVARGCTKLKELGVTGLPLSKLQAMQLQQLLPSGCKLVMQ